MKKTILLTFFFCFISKVYCQNIKLNVDSTSSTIKVEKNNTNIVFSLENKYGFWSCQMDKGKLKEINYNKSKIYFFKDEILVETLNLDSLINNNIEDNMFLNYWDNFKIYFYPRGVKNINELKFVIFEESLDNLGFIKMNYKNGKFTGGINIFAQEQYSKYVLNDSEDYFIQKPVLVINQKTNNKITFLGIKQHYKYLALYKRKKIFFSNKNGQLYIGKTNFNLEKIINPIIFPYTVEYSSDGKSMSYFWNIPKK